MGEKDDPAPDEPDADKMEQCLSSLRAMGLEDGSPAIQEVQTKLDEARKRRREARPLWAQERDLHSKLQRKATLRAQQASEIHAKITTVDEEVRALERQLAEVAKEAFRAAPATGDDPGSPQERHLPASAQVLPQEVLQGDKWQAHIKADAELRGKLQQAAKVEPDRIDKAKADADAAQAEGPTGSGSTQTQDLDGGQLAEVQKQINGTLQPAGGDGSESAGKCEAVRKMLELVNSTCAKRCKKTSAKFKKLG